MLGCGAAPHFREKRTGFNTALWDEFQEDRCLDGKCHGRKVQAHIAQQIARNAQLVQIRTHYGTADRDHILTRDRYTLIKLPKEGKKSKRIEERTCDDARPAIIVDGGQRGSLVQVCSNKQCVVHNAPQPQTEAQRQADKRHRQWQREQKERQENGKQNRQLLESVVKKAPTTLKREDYAMIVSGFAQALSYDDFAVLLKRFGLSTNRAQNDGDLADAFTAKVKDLPEAKLLPLLIKLSLDLRADTLLQFHRKRWAKYCKYNCRYWMVSPLGPPIEVLHRISLGNRNSADFPP